MPPPPWSQGGAEIKIFVAREKYDDLLRIKKFCTVVWGKIIILEKVVSGKNIIFWKIYSSKSSKRQIRHI